MQVEIMDQQDVHTSSHLFHEMHFPSEKQVGKPNNKADHQGKEPFALTKEIDGKAIENLLPDEEDLFSGLIDELGCTAHANGSDEEEDFDLFNTSGGMELEGDCRLPTRHGNAVSTEGLIIDQGSSNGTLVSEQLSRTLVVSNIDSNVEDSELRILFEQYGDIQTLYTACRFQGFVIVSYYDIRVARSAMSGLQNLPLRYGKLGIHYSFPKDNPLGKYFDEASLEIFNLDSSISSDKLRQIFGKFGEIKEICGTTHYHKLIKYYDIRAAEAALRGLNSSDISRDRIKLEVCRPGSARSLMQQQFSPELVQGELRLCRSSNDISLPEATVSPGVIAPSSVKNGYIHGVHSASEMPINAFTENALSQANCCITNSLPSPVGMASVCNQFGLCDPHHSLDQAKLHNHCTSFHPQVLPMNHDGFVDNDVITYGSLSYIADLASEIGLKAVEEINDKHPHTVDSNCLPTEHLGRGSSRTGSFPLDGHHHVLSNSNSLQHHPLRPMIWSNSPPFVNCVSDHSTCGLPVLFEVLPHVLYTISPTHKHHIRSAPSGSLSCGDLRHAYVGESPKALDLHLDPLRIVGFPCSSPLHPSKVSSHNVSHVGGNCMDISSNSAMSSPKNRCHTFSGRDSVTSRMCPKERMKKQWRRKLEVDSCHADQKKYELDIERVLRGEDKRTTLMIRNIPNKYTSKTLLAAIDEQNRGTYDFIYLPIDFKNNCNMGYAFINMIDPLQIIPFHKTFNGKRWEKFHSNKVASLAYARIQGKAALIAHFQDSSLMNEDKFCHPILFVTGGPNAGDQEPFPMGTSTHSRPHRTRCRVSEENRVQDLSSTSAKGEKSYNRKDHLKVNKLLI